MWILWVFRTRAFCHARFQRLLTVIIAPGCRGPAGRPPPGWRTRRRRAGRTGRGPRVGEPGARVVPRHQRPPIPAGGAEIGGAAPEPARTRSGRTSACLAHHDEHGVRGGAVAVLHVVEQRPGGREADALGQPPRPRWRRPRSAPAWSARCRRAPIPPGRGPLPPPPSGSRDQAHRTSTTGDSDQHRPDGHPGLESQARLVRPPVASPTSARRGRSVMSAVPNGGKPRPDVTQIAASGLTSSGESENRSFQIELIRPTRHQADRARATRSAW